MFLDREDANQLRGDNFIASIQAKYAVPADQQDRKAAAPVASPQPSAVLPAPTDPAPLSFSPTAAPAPTAPVTAPLVAPRNGDYRAYARQAATNHQIDPDQFERQINQESGFNPSAVSPAGATGIAQIVPKFHPGVNANDPYASLDYAADLMAKHKKTYGRDDLALVAYNGGQGAVDAYLSGQPYAESKKYVESILSANKAVAKDNPGWLDLAQKQLGKPYIWGSKGGRSDFSDAAEGFDCSGFVSFVYKNGLGIDLPAQTSSAYSATRHIDASEAKPGDVVLYNMDNPDPHIQHIAIYIGDGKVIQAGGSTDLHNVNVAPIATAGTYEFRRADGASDKVNNQAASAVAATVAQPKSDNEWLDSLVKTAGSVTDAVGGAVESAKNSSGDFVSDLLTKYAAPVAESVGQGLLANSETNRGTVNTVGQATGDAFNAVAESTGEGLLIGGEQERRTADQVVQAEVNLQQSRNTEIEKAHEIWGKMLDGTATPEEQKWYADQGVAASNVLASELNAKRPLFGRGGVPGGARDAAGNPIRPEIPAANGDTQDLLQQMLDMARQKRGSDDSTLNALEDSLARMRAPSDPVEAVAKAMDDVRAKGGDARTLENIQESIDSVLRPRDIPNGVQNGQLPLGLNDESPLPYRPRPTANESSGSAVPQRGQLAFDSELPVGGPRPTGNESSGPALPQRGQFSFDSELPMGGPRPTGNEAMGPANTRGQLPLGLYGDTLPTGGPRPTGREAQGPRGRMPQQMDLFEKNPKNPLQLEMEQAAAGHPMNMTERILARTRGNLLTAPITAGLQITGGAVETIGRPLRTLAAGEGRAAIADISAMGRGIGAGWVNAKDALLYGYRRSAAEMGKGQGVELVQGPKALLPWNTPGYRVMSSIDEFVQTINAHGAMAMAASVEARATGRTVADLIEHPTPWMKDVSRKAATAATYTEGASPIGQAIISAKSRLLKGNAGAQAMGAAMDVLIPFVSIPDRVITRGLKMMAGGSIEYGQAWGIATGSKFGKAGDGLATHQRAFAAKTRATEGLLATTSMALIGAWALEGTITGEGASNWSPEYKRQLQKTIGNDGQPVWQPHSVKIGGRWVDYTSVGGPWAVPMSAIGTAVEEFKHSGKQPGPELVNKAINGAVRGISRQYYLQNLTDLVVAVQNGDFTGALEKQAASVATRAVPLAGALGTIARSTDETKNPSNIVERVEANFPGVNGLVRDKLTPLGQPDRPPKDLASVLIPGRPTAPSVPTPVMQIITNAGMSIPAPPKQINIPNSQAQIPLNEDSQDYYQQVYGAILQAELTPLAPLSDTFRQLPLAVQRTALARAMGKAQEQAKAATLAHMGLTSGLSVEPRPLTNLPPVR